MTHIIADSGSTKIDWLILSGKTQTRVQTGGYNPNYASAEDFSQSVKQELLPKIDSEKINRIHFYGAGCSSKINRKATTKLLQTIFSTKNVIVRDDLLGAARACCKDKPGIVSILGTGSNCCKYNGKKISFRRISMGYLLADEGSAYAIGKAIVRNYINGTLSKKAQRNFFEMYNLTRFDLIPTIYSNNDSHDFIAKFSKFAHENIADKSVHKLVYQSLDQFVRKHILSSPNYKKFDCYFVGSIAFHFSDILQEVLTHNELSFGKVLKSPIDEIADFHQNYDF
ncbi:MAG: hypothetical protein KDD94_05565 [Calditrichaeota bacterium]|nr:hypothetical protein [Calditrichota bacterium]